MRIETLLPWPAICRLAKSRPMCAQRIRTVLSVAIATLAVAVSFFHSAAPASAQSGYGLRAGDVLRVEVLEDTSLNRSVLIAPDGRINFPQAGSIPVAGRTVNAVQSALISRLSPSFAAPPTVFVSLEKLAERVERPPVVQAPPAPDPVISVFIVGEANKPGQVEVAPGTTVLQMFAVMGGFTKFAATSRVQLRRTEANGQEQVYVLDYSAIEAGLSPNGRATLTDGDVIIVPQRRLFE